MSDDIIKKALGMNVENAPEDQALVPIEGIVHQDDDVTLDFEYVATNLKDLIAQGMDSINECILVAKQSQHPRAFEVLATLLKAVADINTDLLNLHKKKADLRPKDAPKSSGPITNNNVFVGSTAELQKMLDNMKKNNE